MTGVIGIDPGKSGGIAVLGESGNVRMVCKMPLTPHDLAEALSEYRECFAIIEKVGPARGRDGRKQGVSSAFTFGFGTGVIHGVIAACGIPFEEVSPVKWQTAMGCRSGGDKNVTKARAQQLFPNVKVTHANADSLLIAEYARRTRSQQCK